VSHHSITQAVQSTTDTTRTAVNANFAIDSATLKMAESHHILKCSKIQVNGQDMCIDLNCRSPHHSPSSNCLKLVIISSTGQYPLGPKSLFT